jgi:superfamily II DNA or RNA helicase
LSTIYIEKISETYIKINSTKDIETELSQYFTFESPGAKYTPLYKAKRWDGMIRLYNRSTKLLYAGLYDMVVSWAENNGYEIEIIQNEYYTIFSKEKEVDREKVEAWINSLDVHDGYGNPIEVREYQIDAFIQAIKTKRIILLSPTASGKSLIIYLLVRFFQMINKKMLLVVPSVALVQQMFNDFNDYALTQEWKSEDNCQEIYAGKTKEITKSVTISTWQSLYDLKNKSFFEQFDVVFGDEAHQFKSKSLCTIMEKLSNAKYRVATTGTIDEKSSVNILTLTGLFGKQFTVSTLRELMDDGFISQLKIKVLVLKHSDEVRKVVSKYDYKNEINYICCDQERNEFIAKLALSCDGNTLILVNYVEKHAKPLIEMISEMVKGTDRKVFGIFGSASIEDLKGPIEKENNCTIIASYSKFSTGANVPSIRNIIFGSPNKSYIRIFQSLGRGLRLHKNKDYCTLYDIIDNLSWKKKRNTTIEHGTERIKMYNDQEFNYDIEEIDL